jgi:hypothetical protein
MDHASGTSRVGERGHRAEDNSLIAQVSFRAVEIPGREVTFAAGAIRQLAHQKDSRVAYMIRM